MEENGKRINRPVKAAAVFYLLGDCNGEMAVVY